MNQQPFRFYILIGFIVLQDLIQGIILKEIPLIVCSITIFLFYLGNQYINVAQFLIKTNKFQLLSFLFLLIFFAIQIYYYSTKCLWFLICISDQFIVKQLQLNKIYKITLLMINVILESIQYNQQLQYSLFQNLNYSIAFIILFATEKTNKQSKNDIAQNLIFQELQKNIQLKIFTNNLQDYSNKLITEQNNINQYYQMTTNNTASDDNHNFYIKIYTDSDFAGSPQSVNSSSNLIFYDCKQFIQHVQEQQNMNSFIQQHFIAVQIDEQNHTKIKFKVLYNSFENGSLIILSFIKLDPFLIKQNKEKLNKFKKEFYNIFAHKLKTPLNTCLGFLYQTFHNVDVGTEIRQQLIKPAYINSKLQYFQISDLLQFLNPAADQTAIQRCKINMKTFLSDLNELIELQCKNKNIQFQITINNKRLSQIDNINITQDAFKLERVLYNLLNLSYRYTSSNGNINLIIKINQDDLEIEFIIDWSGCGFNNDEVENLNQWIKNKNKNFNQNKQLFIKKELRMTLEITNNLINLLSEQEQSLLIEQSEMGTMFKFKIPIMENKTADVSQEHLTVGFMLQKRSIRNMKSSQNNNVSLKSIFSGTEPFIQPQLSQKVIDEPIPHSPLQSKINNQKQKRKQKTIKTIRRIRSSFLNKCIDSDKSILIVDDEPFNHDTLILMLKSLGYKNFEKAFNGQQAIDIVKQQEFKISIILMDLDMPIMGGLEATQILVQLMIDQELNYIPIIGCTAHDDKETLDKCIEVGMLNVVQKPVFVKTLREAFSQIINSEEIKRRSVICFTSQLQI